MTKAHRTMRRARISPRAIRSGCARRFCSVAFAGLVAAAGLNIVATAAAQTPTDPRLPSVTVTGARTAEVVGRVPISGTLVPRDEVLVYPQVNGYIIETIDVDIGDVVEAGAVLAVLNSSTLAAQLAEADAELLRAEAAVRQAGSQIESARASQTQANSALARSENLRSSGTLAQATLDQNVATAQTARAAVASAEDGLAVAKAQAPAGRGAARHRPAQPGARPRSGRPSRRRSPGATDKVGAIAALRGRAGVHADRATARSRSRPRSSKPRSAGSRSRRSGRLSDRRRRTATGTVRLIAPTVNPVTRLGLVRIAVRTRPRPAQRALRQRLDRHRQADGADRPDLRRADRRARRIRPAGGRRPRRRRLVTAPG